MLRLFKNLCEDKRTQQASVLSTIQPGYDISMGSAGSKRVERRYFQSLPPGRTDQDITRYCGHLRPDVDLSDLLRSPQESTQLPLH